MCRRQVFPVLCEGDESARKNSGKSSEPDSTPRRRPPTIDLTAKEVETERPSQPSGGTEAASDQARRGDGAGQSAGWKLVSEAKPYAMAAAGGAIVTAAILAGLWFTGLAPSRGGAPPAAPAANAAAASATAADDISARLDKIQGALQARPADAALTGRVAAAEAETKALSETLAALNRRLDDIAVTARSALAHADAAAAAADASKSAAQAGVGRGDLDAIANRVAALEHAVKSLAEDAGRRAPSADDRAARMAVAAEALRAVVERGAPYAAELAAVKSLGAEASALAELEPFAAEGIPGAAALARELADLTPALLSTAGGPASAGSVLARMELSAQRLVRITPIDAPQGDDPAAQIARINAAAARNEAAALAEIAKLPGPARALAAPWSKKVAAREAAIAASRRIAADALAALGRPAAQ
jgi:hypothetical protein